MTRIYVTRVDDLGFTKLTKMKMTNLGEDWLSFEIKVVGPKLTVYLDGKMLIMGLEEPDIKFIAERSGTMMFGVNDVMAQFSDIFMS